MNKRIQLLIVSMRIQIRNNRIFFLSLLLIQYIGVFILMFGNAAIQNSHSIEKDINEKARYFNLNLLHYSETETVKEIVGYKSNDGISEPIYRDTPVQEYDKALTLPTMIDRCNNVLEENTWISPSEIWITAKYDDYKIRMVYLADDNIFLNSSKPLVWLNSNKFSDYKVGDSFELNGIVFTVDNISSNLIGDITMAAQYAPSNCLCSELYMYFPQSPTTTQAHSFSALLGKYFDYSELYEPEAIDPLTVQFNSMTIVLCWFMILIVATNISYAFSYLYQLQKRMFSTYKLCGASTNSILQLCLSETSIVFILSYFICTVLFHLLLRKEVITLYPVSEGLYTIRFYLILGGVFLCTILVVLGFMVKNWMKMDIIAAVKEV